MTTQHYELVLINGEERRVYACLHHKSDYLPWVYVADLILLKWDSEVNRRKITKRLVPTRDDIDHTTVATARVIGSRHVKVRNPTPLICLMPVSDTIVDLLDLIR